MIARLLLAVSAIVMLPFVVSAQEKYSHLVGENPTHKVALSS